MMAASRPHPAMTSPLDRRTFLRGAVLGSAGAAGLLPPAFVPPAAAAVPGFAGSGAAAGAEPVPYAATGYEHGPLPLPAGKRVAFGWKVVPVPNDERGLVLTWRPAGPVTADRFRLTVGLDEREEKKVEARLARSGRVLGLMDIKYGCYCQMFDLPLAPGDADAIVREGLRLRVLEQRAALWIFGGPDVRGAGHEYLLPHLLTSDDHGPWNPAFARLASLASVQPFGWIEGCVLEGLTALERGVPAWSGRAALALDQHLDLFFASDRMTMEDPRSVPSDNTWFSVEATLMIPALVRRRPGHAIVSHAREWMMKQPLPKRDSSNGSHSEGCYTLAYPLAEIARARGDVVALNAALEHLLMRKHQLVRGDTLFQRNFGGKRGHAGENWSRGIAWYMLGHARVLQLAGVGASDKTREAAAELERVCRWVVTSQRTDGLWTCYAHRPETGPETSGTAGIAAALLLAHELGLAPASVQDVARRALQGLERYLSPDGFLHGVTQSNKGGEELQRSGYRVYLQMGLGLAVQLAALHPAVGGR